MSALGKVRFRLAGARKGIIDLRREYKSRDNRAAIDHIIRGIEALMDHAEQALNDPRSGASKSSWRDGEGEQP